MDRARFFAALRRSGIPGFARLSQRQVEGIEGILDAFVVHGDGREKTLAYGLATARREVGSDMQPVREGFKKTDAAARAYVAKNYPFKSYSKPKPPYGHVYYGRGLVQLTHDYNYKAEGLLENPDGALEPQFAAGLLFRGLLDGRWNKVGKGIAHYLPTNGPDDLKNARRTVNLTDHWQEIAGYYEAFLKAIREAGGVPTKPEIPKPTPRPAQPPHSAPAPSPAPEPAPRPERAPAASQGGFWARLAELFRKLIRGGR